MKGPGHPGPFVATQRAFPLKPAPAEFVPWRCSAPDYPSSGCCSMVRSAAPPRGTDPGEAAVPPAIAEH